MTALIAILACAILFALFGLLRPRRGNCSGDSCSTCSGSCDLAGDRDHNLPFGR